MLEGAFSWISSKGMILEVATKKTMLEEMRSWSMRLCKCPNSAKELDQRTRFRRLKDLAHEEKAIKLISLRKSLMPLARMLLRREI